MEHEDVTARCSSSNGTAPNKLSHDQTEETNGISIPQRFDSKNPFEGRTTHFTDDLWTYVSIITFIADVGTDLLVCVKYYKEKNLWWFSLTLGFALLASFSMQVFSAKWLLEDGKRQQCFTYILHLFHLGPVQRYWNVLKCGWKARQKNASIPEFAAFLAEWRDISMLRLLQAFLESAPQLVLQLYILLQRPPFGSKDNLLTAVAAACSLVSIIWAILAYSKSLRDFRKQGYVLSAAGLFFQILWRISMMFSRVVAMVLFASYFKQWLFVAVGAHWMMMTMWLICQRTRFCTDEDGKEHPYREKLFSAVIGFIYIFCFFNTREGMTRKRVVLFYSIILVENSLFVSMWYPHRTFCEIMSIAALGVVWGGLVFGIVCMVLYYRFYHPSLPVQGIFLQKRSFDLEGEKAHTWVCCCCCRVRRSRGRNTALDQNAAEGMIRNVNRSENHHPALELEILPGTPSWELIQEGLYVERDHFQHTGTHDPFSDPDSPTNILVHSTPARPLGMSSSQASHPLITSRVPKITVTGATPEVMSPRDSVSNSSLVTLKEVDMETLDNVVQRPDQSARAAESAKIATDDAEPGELDTDKQSRDVTYTSPRSPTACEIISWFHPEQSACEASLDAEEDKTEKINYGSLSFGNRYSLVSSDCISLSSESSRSSVDSIVFADEGPGSSGVNIEKTLSDEFTPRAMDEGIFSDERDSPAKASVPEDADTHSEPSTPQTSRINAQFPALNTNSNTDKLKGVQSNESADKLPPLSNASDEDNFDLVELLMDAPSSPLSSLQRRKREAGNSLSSEEKASVESKPSNTREWSVSEQEDGHESESTDASSDSNYTRNRHRSCDEIETGASGIPSSPEEINKRHTFDFSQLSKSARPPRRRRDRKHRRSKRKEFDNFVVTTLRPGKYGSLRGSIDPRLAKIQEDTEESFLLNTEAALNACIPEDTELSSPSHDTNVLQTKIEDDSTKKQDLNCSADSSNTYVFEPQENSMVSERENFMKRKRMKRFLSKELVPGKFSSVRLSCESGPSDENFQIFHESEISSRQHKLSSTVSADNLPSRHSNSRIRRTNSGNRRKEFRGKTVSLPDVIRSTGTKLKSEIENNPDPEKTVTNRIKTSSNAILIKYTENSARYRDLVPVLNKRHTYDFTNNSAGQVQTREQLLNTENGKRSAEDRHQRRAQSEVLISTRTSSVYV